MSIGLHIKEHEMLGFTGSSAVFGGTGKTVGDGGDFATITEALTWLATQTMMDQITTSPLDTMTINVSQHSDTVTTSVPTLPDSEDRLDIFTNDLMFVDNDANSTWFALGSPSTHYYPVLKKGNQPAGATDNFTVTLYGGLIGTTKSAYAATWWRPRKYAIILLPGRHQIPADIAIPDGCNLYIGGFGQATEVYGTMASGTGGLANTTMLAPRYGFVHIDNITFQGTSVLRPWSDALPNFSESTTVVKMSNCIIRGSAQVLQSCLFHGHIMQNVHVYDCMDHGVTLCGDFMIVDGFYSHTSEGSESAYINLTGNYWTMTTKEKLIKNFQIERSPPSPNRGSTAALRVALPSVYGGATRVSFMNGIIKDNLGYASGGHYCARVDAGGSAAEVNFYNVVFDGIAPINEDIRTNGGVSLNVNCINCWQPDGTTLTFSDDGGGATVVNKLPTWV